MATSRKSRPQNDEAASRKGRLIPLHRQLLPQPVCGNPLQLRGQEDEPALAGVVQGPRPGARGQQRRPDGSVRHQSPGSPWPACRPGVWPLPDPGNGGRLRGGALDRRSEGGRTSTLAATAIPGLGREGRILAGGRYSRSAGLDREGGHGLGGSLDRGRQKTSSTATRNRRRTCRDEEGNDQKKRP